MTSDYEVTFILKPSLDEAATEASVQLVAESLTKLGGTIKNVEPLGRRRLTHEIKDLREGFYAVITFAADPSNIREFERQLSLNDDVLRHIVVRHEAKKAKKKSELAATPPRRLSD
jgi:small subunit ribosomal protein S6